MYKWKIMQSQYRPDPGGTTQEIEDVATGNLYIFITLFFTKEPNSDSYVMPKNK